MPAPPPTARPPTNAARRKRAAPSGGFATAAVRDASEATSVLELDLSAHLLCKCLLTLYASNLRASSTSRFRCSGTARGTYTCSCTSYRSKCLSMVTLGAIRPVPTNCVERDSSALAVAMSAGVAPSALLQSHWSSTVEQLLSRKAVQEDNWRSVDSFATTANKLRLQQQLRTRRLKCDMQEPIMEHVTALSVISAQAAASDGLD
eukprot:1261379-Pleurochrysis_carterae.AAC.1